MQAPKEGVAQLREEMVGRIDYDKKSGKRVAYQTNETQKPCRHLRVKSETDRLARMRGPPFNELCWVCGAKRDHKNRGLHCNSPHNSHIKGSGGNGKTAHLILRRG